MNIHVSLVPYIKAAGELKTKPTQHSVQELRRIGITPHMLVCRTEKELPKALKDKLALSCDIDRNAVIEAGDAQSIYQMPLHFIKDGILTPLQEHFNIKIKPNMEKWDTLVKNDKFRKEVIKKLEDEDLIDFWKNELGKAGDMQKVKMAAGITAKIGRFNANASARLILSQKKSTIDFEDIMNSGKILICNFSKGLLGEDVSELFGIAVLAKLQLASLRRARLNQSERRPFYLYVDEFQNFATPSFVQLLSEARKYRLFLTIAEQSTSQQDDQQMVNVILANVGTVVCFRTGNPQDERMLLPLFSPFIEQGEISNLPAFNFYAKLSAVHAQEPLSGQTLLLDSAGSDEVVIAVIEHSRAVFATKHVEPEEKPAEKKPEPKPTKTKPKRQARKRKATKVLGD
jgi:hypothetical protein